MLKKRPTLLALGTIGTLALVRASTRSNDQLDVVPKVDLTRYAGRWYEIARLPNRFQRNCDANTSALYTLRDDGKIMVLNQCETADGKAKSTKGTAHVASDQGPNTKLKVTFFWPFYGDYWIIDLDPEYRWAVVSEPSRKYLWILSRQPKMDETEYNPIVERIKANGFDLSSMIRTKQTRTVVPGA